MVSLFIGIWGTLLYVWGIANKCLYIEFTTWQALQSCFVWMSQPYYDCNPKDIYLN